jgi:hypothetical protein
MTGRQVADAVNALGALKSPLTAKKLAPILAHLGVKSAVRHNQNCYIGLCGIENAQGEIDSVMSPEVQVRCPPMSPSGGSADENGDGTGFDDFLDGGH